MYIKTTITCSLKYIRASPGPESASIFFPYIYIYIYTCDNLKYAALVA